MLDIVWRCDKDNKVTYVWFDTGLEYQATKDHLKYLEEKYNITIHPYKAIKPIPTSCKMYGQPFLSKTVSKYIYNLQKYNFKWENKSFEELKKEYKGIDSYLKWWCNKNSYKCFNVSYNKYLKEFLIQNPPYFKISDKCCYYAKKNVAHKCIKENKYDLNIIGVRKAEGGIRSASYKSCFDENGNGYDNYRPLFWYKTSDKNDYELKYDILHSKCYTEYGFTRTGCCCCPYAGKDIEYELEVTKKYEPRLYKAVNHIFGDSYEYTRKYREFCKQMKEKEKR